MIEAITIATAATVAALLLREATRPTKIPPPVTLATLGIDPTTPPPPAYLMPTDIKQLQERIEQEHAHTFGSGSPYSPRPSRDYPLLPALKGEILAISVAQWGTAIPCLSQASDVGKQPESK